ncbi:MAG: IS4 family transposase, partial [Actinomycetia bacterium]|nr:IS4 family transposase [Actinomycetes bacterium]
GDARRNRRAQRVLGQLGDKPRESIPGACGGWTETRAVYRLFDRAEVTAEKVLAPHIACTAERLREHPRVLCIQDTSELDYTGKTDIQGLGPLNYESRQGLYLHPTLAVTPDRLCLGVLDIYSWVREPGSLGRNDDPNRPLEEKESVRWVDGYQKVNELAEQLTDTRLTYVAEREGDIYDLFVEAPCPESAADWLVRGQHDRALADGGTLRQSLAEAPVLTEMSFDQPGGNGRTARTVHQELKVVCVTLKAPYRPDRVLPDFEVTAILATEPNPPAGEEPVEWLLLTNLPVETTEQALEKLQWYLCRWQIEIYF